MFALIDCNNFFVSCERVFNPRLRNRPVIVLSSNDGCAVARSNEAKRIGIAMGAPLYQVAHLVRSYRVATLSSNFELYGDMSDRVMHTLAQWQLPMQIYSIDEAFLQLPKSADWQTLGEQLRQQVSQHTGIPVSIGIAPSKVLAKLAANIAKKTPEGVTTLSEPTAQRAALAHCPVESLWGISQRFGKQLRYLGVTTALQLHDLPQDLVRKKFGINGKRLQLELQGTPCFSLRESPKAKKSITATRTFGMPVQDLQIIEQALSHFAARACEKLRKQNSITHTISVLLKNNHFNQRERYYRRWETVNLPAGTNDSCKIISAAKQALRYIYRPGLHYRKAGILLSDLEPVTGRQTTLFQPQAAEPSARMRLIDNLNKQLGKRTLFYAAEGTEKKWATKCDLRSPRYTTVWEELLKVY